MLPACVRLEADRNKCNNHRELGSAIELVPINEELQSTNEELEPSKEELQSVNEELHTVNAD